MRGFLVAGEMSAPDKVPVPPRRFTELLITYQRTQHPAIKELLTRTCFYPLVAGLLRKYRFNHVDPQDALQESVSACVDKIPRFDFRRPTKYQQSSGDPHRKAFSFFTMISMNVYRGMYRKAQSVNRGNDGLITQARERFYRENPNIRQKHLIGEFEDSQLTEMPE